MRILLRLFRFLLAALFLAGLFGVAALAGAYYYLEPQLPSIDTLKDVRFQVPLRVYSGSGDLIGEFGEMRRTPVAYDQIPPLAVKAFLAAEDDRFFEHPGVDYQGLLRAALSYLRTGEASQGGSTITMQVARNYFLSPEKTLRRKLSEILLALKIEHGLSKQEIISLYLNKIYLGQRAYGVAAAAQTYYGKPLDQLNIAQLAMVAGLPKAPSAFNPIANPERALMRRNYVLRRMHELGHIDTDQFRIAVDTPDDARLHSHPIEVDAPYVAEMVRAEMVARFGNDAYTTGYRVYTTIDNRLQDAANRALRNALLDYSRRHGYRGPEARVDLAKSPDSSGWQQALAGYAPIGGLLPAVVSEVKERSATVMLTTGVTIELPWAALEWAKRHVDDDRLGPTPKKAGDVLHKGDIIRVLHTLEGKNPEGKWTLAELPEVAGALVSLRSDDGAVTALAGGFDFYRSKFNRVTQAKRQPGSSFKPFVYSAGLEKGFTPASLINDAPIVFDGDGPEAEWRPENYSGRFYGPTRLREALVQSRNLVSIRLLRSIGIDYALDYFTRFGFDPKQLPPNLPLALGTASLTPLEIARGYAVFSNGGHLIEPYFIARIETEERGEIEKANPAVVCNECGRGAMPIADNLASPPRIAPRTIDARNAYMMTSMMQDVIRRGTATRAKELGRNDIAGKTGTTNESRDAWFCGFNRDIVTTAWVGFDTPRSLGHAETGGRAALPMWIEYMRAALTGHPEHTLEQPPGLTLVRIDPDTGLRAAADRKDAIFEVFAAENLPEWSSDIAGQPGAPSSSGSGGSIEQLF